MAKQRENTKQHQKQMQYFSDRRDKILKTKENNANNAKERKRWLQNKRKREREKSNQAIMTHQEQL